MDGIPEKIVGFIADHHVLSLCVWDRDGPWAASCFYAFDRERARLIVLTATSTRHGARMRDEERVAGTIAGQPAKLRDIRGVQYTARAELLDGSERQAALALYGQRHPMARLASGSEVWSLDLTALKLTDNRLLFGQKTHWRRDEDVR